MKIMAKFFCAQKTKIMFVVVVEKEVKSHAHQTHSHTHIWIYFDDFQGDVNRFSSNVGFPSSSPVTMEPVVEVY
jgi:hypothetical protein